MNAEGGPNETMLPRYRCHKTVQAAEIGLITKDAGSIGGRRLFPDDPRFPPIKVSGEYMAKYHPIAGGYYVVYEDGYESYSPKKAFEDGYSLLTDEAPTDQSS